MKVVDKFLDVMGFLDNDEEDEQEEIIQRQEESQTEPQYKRKKGQLVAIHNYKSDSAKVVVVEPKNFDEAQVIADNLKNHRAVIVNMENIELSLAKRIIDFVGGTAYALDGTMQKIGRSIILVVPPNIDIGGEITEDYFEDQEDVFSWVSKFAKRGEI